MTYTRAQQIAQLEASLADQDTALQRVREVLGNLPPNAVLQVSHAWTEAFESATEVDLRPTHRAPIGALRV